MKVAAIWALVLLAFLFFVPSSIKAQTHPCGAGPGPNEVQVGVEPGGNGVAPTPMCDWVNNNQQQPPPPQWADRWGAIATDSINGILGAITNASDQNQAKQLAMSDCQAKGGLHCKINAVYGNECAVMVAGDKGYNFSANATANGASRDAMKVCSAADTHCHVYYSACSPPVRIQ